jgi:hypothetical protein
MRQRQKIQALLPRKTRVRRRRGLQRLILARRNPPHGRPARHNCVPTQNKPIQKKIPFGSFVQFSATRKTNPIKKTQFGSFVPFTAQTFLWF